MTRILVAQSPDDVADAQAVEAAVFGKEFGNDAALLAREYGRYEQRSVWLLARGRGGRPIASTRLLPGTCSKTLDDLAAGAFRPPPAALDEARRPGHPELVRRGAGGPAWFERAVAGPVSGVVDVATMAVLDEHRGSLVGLAMTAVTGRAAIEARAGLLCVFEVSAHRAFSAAFGPALPILPGCPAADYLGAHSVAVAGDPAAVTGAHLRGELGAAAPGLDVLVAGAAPGIGELPYALLREALLDTGPLG